jgi:large subunit ribosomal protein L20
MSRVKRGTTANKRRNYLLKRAKGYKAGGRTKFRLAKQRLFKAESNAYISRKLRKRDFRQLWITRINGALDAVGSELNYSKFIYLLNTSDLNLNRKMISEIAIENLESFKLILARVQGAKAPKKPAIEAKEIELPKAEKPKVAKVSEVVKPKTLVEEALVEVTESVVITEEETPKKAKITKVSNFDDLKIVEGIGPAIEKLLHEADITTYEQLAKSEETVLREILSQAGSRFTIHDPVNWAKQSQLAAEGKFEELEVLKKELVRGK